MKIKLSPLKIIITLAVLLIIGTVGIYFSGNDKAPPPLVASPELQQMAQTVALLDVEERSALMSVVKEIHTELNLAVGFNQTPDETQASNLVDNALKIKPIVENEISFEPLKKDLEELIERIIAATPKDRNSGWVRAHRIAHDLDYHLINPKSSHMGERSYFGVTRAIPALDKEVTSGSGR